MSNNTIRIVYLIDRMGIGGTENQILDTIEQFKSKDNFEIILICLRESKYYSTKHSDIQIPCESHILGVHSLASFNSIIKLIKFIFFLRRRKINIVQPYFIDSTLFGIIAAKLARVKKIISCRRDLGFSYTTKTLRALKISNLFVEHFLVNCEAVKREISKLEGIKANKISVIYNGIDMRLVTHIADIKLKNNLKILPDEYIIGIVANLNREVKRVDVAIKAMSIVFQELKNVKFIIIGDGYLKENLKDLSAQLNIEKQIIFTGRLNDVYPYVSMFDIGVLSSDSEGFSNSIIEYMAFGKPVIATDAGGNGEIIKNGMNGYLVPSGDFESMAKLIIDLLKDSKKRIEMGLNAVSFVRKQYSWSNKINEIEDYYYRIMGVLKK